MAGSRPVVRYIQASIGVHEETHAEINVRDQNVRYQDAGMLPRNPIISSISDNVEPIEGVGVRKPLGVAHGSTLLSGDEDGLCAAACCVFTSEQEHRKLLV